MDIIKIAKENSTHNELTETIVKEILHYEILKSIYSNKESLNTLVFQGGTALRLCYGGMRYSEDLDFCIADNKDFDIGVMQQFKNDFTKSIMQKYGLQVEVKEPKMENNSIVKKWIAKVFVPFPRDKKTPAIHIEVANINSYDNAAKIVRSLYPKNTDEILVRAESENEILADKIIAFGDRDYMKYRDIWDIKSLQDKGVKVNIDLVIKKISDYNIANLSQKLITKLDELNNSTESKQKFYAELYRFLGKDVYNRIVDVDFFTDVKKSTNEIIAEAIKQLQNQQPKQELTAREQIKAMPQHSAEKKAAAVAYLRENRIDSSQNGAQTESSQKVESKPKIRRNK